MHATRGFCEIVGVALALTIVSVARAQYSGGTGEPNDPYQIATAADLIAFGDASDTLHRHFILIADIDLDPNLPGGRVFDKALIADFRGVFNGNGHTISHLTVKGGDKLGLFAYLGHFADVKDLGVVDVDIAGSGSCVGGLVGRNGSGRRAGNVTRCYCTGVVKGKEDVGGLVGHNEGTLSDCHSTALVTGEQMVGGLAGSNYCEVIQSYSTGMVSGGPDVGGLVGYSYGGVYECFSTGAVSGRQRVGGLVGYNYCGPVCNCYSSASVAGDEDVGGLVGRNDEWGNVNWCCSIGRAEGNSCIGGLIGRTCAGTIYCCYSTAGVSGRLRVGGLTGASCAAVVDEERRCTDFYHCYSAGPVVGETDVGGLVGYNEGDVRDCFWDTQTSGQTTSAGGIGKTTAEMQTGVTFLTAMWYTCAQPVVWTIDEGRDYPRLRWEDKPGAEIQPIRLSGILAGEGTQENPYLIFTPEDLNMLGLAMCDLNKHFRLMADIDLSGFDGREGRPAFNIIAPGKEVVYDDGYCWGSYCQGHPFTGVFDGNGHTIWNFTYASTDTAKVCIGLFGHVDDPNAQIKDLGLIDPNVMGSSVCCETGGGVGCLVGCLENGIISGCCARGGSVTGASSVGGLVGSNGRCVLCRGEATGEVESCWSGEILNSYAGVLVSGGGTVGGLVGYNQGTVIGCRSTGAVSGTDDVGGLVGYNREYGIVAASFWDIQTSGQTTSAGGTGKTTTEMRTASTFLDAGWDFVGETANGGEDIWWILEGKDYPRLFWELPEGLHLRPVPAFCPDPCDGAMDTVQSLVLRWCAGTTATGHDVYFGEDADVVARASRDVEGIYRGWQPADVTVYDPGALERSRTYYWRIDEVNEAEPNSPWKGSVWSFTTADSIVVTIIDDFESYSDNLCADCAIWSIWVDGLVGNTSGSRVGYYTSPFEEHTIVHGGRQSMPFFYDNDGMVREQSGIPFYSECVRTWHTPQNWMTDNADTLTLYFRGRADNAPDVLYLAIEDSAGNIASVCHPYADTLLTEEWQEWSIVLADVQTAGVGVASVERTYIGVGNRDDPQPGGAGLLYIDDIRLTKRMKKPPDVAGGLGDSERVPDDYGI